jgi:arsenate reductase (thioredoxin)
MWERRRDPMSTSSPRCKFFLPHAARAHGARYTPGSMTILFACTHNAGRSQMAAALLGRAAGGRVRVLSAGTQPAAEIHPVVRQALAEIGLDVTHTPQLLTREIAEQADVLVTMGCGESCPVVPGVRRIDWAVEDPKGQPLERVRRIRDDVARRVAGLVEELEL